jgi:hypothetical protein
VAGEEIIGEVLSDSPEFVVMKNPCVIGLMMQGPGHQPSLNMQRLLPFSKQNSVSVRKSNLLFETDVDEKIEMKYNEIFGNIIVAQPKIITG